MDLTLTEDQELIQSAARDFLESRQADAGARAMAGDPAGWSVGLWKQMVELGWTGLALPEAHGGLAASFLDVCLLAEEMGRAQVPSPFLATVVCCGLPIARFGSDEQKSEWLTGIAKGRVMSCVRGAARGQWGAGSGVVATETGDGFTLDGGALFVPYARDADGLLVVARRGDDEAAEPAVFLMAAGTPGISREPLEVIGAERLYRVGFDGVRVPAGAALGGPGGLGAGRAAADLITAYGTAATCAEMVGGAQRVLDMTVGYATDRKAFGRPIGSFQAVQHHCADMAMDVLGSRFIAYEAIWRLSESLDAATEVSMAKAWVSEAYQRVCALGHQVHGAIGFTGEHDMHVFSRHAMAAALAFGDGDHHFDRVAHQLGLPAG